MKIRPATPSDAGTIARIHVATWQAAYRGLIPDPVLDALDVESRVAFWERLLSVTHDTFVAESGSGIIGFCSLIPSRDGDAAVAEIAALYVAPAHWRQGAGRTLCSAAFRAAVEGGFSGITLWVLTGNSAAISFYETQGFSRDGATRIEEISNGASPYEVRMARQLP